MKTLISLFILLFSSAYAIDFYQYVGDYESKSAAQSGYYEAQELSYFTLRIDPNGIAVVHFPDWDLEAEIEEDETRFEIEQISECEDPGCSGVSYIDGKLSMKNIDGKPTPVATVNMYFYHDRSEDMDCDEVDCRWEDMFLEWEESYEFILTVKPDDVRPVFRSIQVDGEYKKLTKECKKFDYRAQAKCASAQLFIFTNEITDESLENLRSHLYTNFKQTISMSDASTYLDTYFAQTLLDLKLFAYKGEESQAYLQVKKNFFALKELIKNEQADKVFIADERNRYAVQSGISLYFVNKKEKTVRRFILKSF